MAQRGQARSVAWLRQALANTLRAAHTALHYILPNRSTPRASATPRASGPGAPVFEKLKGMQQDFEQATVRLGIIGEAGSGKSSLINAIVGREVAPVGALIETTQQAQEVPVDGLTLVDLPGCGTPTWPRDTYIGRLQLREAYDGFILVTASRLKECDALLFQELSRKAGKPFFVVRSHFDLAVAAHGEAEARTVIVPYIRQQLQAGPDLPVYLVSSVSQPHYDLERLILDIRASLPEWKQVRFIMVAHAYGRATLAKKREAAEKVVGIYAGLAAANALNPIPGLDVSVDLGILAAMSRYVISTYGLSAEQIASLQRQAHLRATVMQAIRELADRFTPYLTEKFLITLLRRMGVEVLLKSSSKWVPFVGTLVSAGLGYRLTYQLGEKLIDQCEAAAQELQTLLEEDPR